MEKITQIIDRHFNHKESLTKLSKEFGICRNRITKEFKKLNLIPINYQNSVKFDDKIFDSINTEDKAYWLGFIAADGYISDEGIFEIALSSKDEGHLIKFKEFIKHSCNIKTTESRSRIYFRSPYLKESLSKYNITPRKSLTLNFPDNIPENLIRHFIRGYFDGDGCIHYRKYVKKNPVLISILGTELFLNKMRQYLPKINKLYKNNGSDKTLVYRVTGIKAENLLRYLYTDCSIYLERKHELFCRLK